MARVIEAARGAQDARFAIVVSRFNAAITEKLLAGAVETLKANQVPDDHIVVAQVPGAWEIPLVTKRLIATGDFEAVLCLGAVIRGETTHDTYINQQVSAHLSSLALEFNIPVLFGVLTCQTIEQAKNRAGGRVGNKGCECAESALEMIGLLRALD